MSEQPDESTEKSWRDMTVEEHAQHLYVQLDRDGALVPWNDLPPARRIHYRQQAEDWREQVAAREQRPGKPPPGSRKAYEVEHCEDFGGHNAEGGVEVRISVSWPDSNTGERDDVLVALARAYAKAVEQFTDEDLATWD